MFGFFLVLINIKTKKLRCPIFPDWFFLSLTFWHHRSWYEINGFAMIDSYITKIWFATRKLRRGSKNIGKTQQKSFDVCKSTINKIMMSILRRIKMEKLKNKRKKSINNLVRRRKSLSLMATFYRIEKWKKKKGKFAKLCSTEFFYNKFLMIYHCCELPLKDILSKATIFVAITSWCIRCHNS